MVKQLDSCPKCGCKEFRGRRVVYMNVFVGLNGKFKRYDTKKKIYDADEPHGPFTCRNCGLTVENLPIFIKK